MTEFSNDQAPTPAAQPQTDADWEALRQLNEFELQTKEHELDAAEPTPAPSKSSEEAPPGE